MYVIVYLIYIPVDYSNYDWYCLRVVNVNYNRWDAGVNTQLVNIDSQALNNAVSKLMNTWPNYFKYWIWNKKSNNPSGYTNWARGEPTGDANGDCIQIYSWDGTWNDCNCNDNYYSIARVDVICDAGIILSCTLLYI